MGFRQAGIVVFSKSGSFRNQQESLRRRPQRLLIVTIATCLASCQARIGPVEEGLALRAARPKGDGKRSSHVMVIDGLGPAAGFRAGLAVALESALAVTQ